MTEYDGRATQLLHETLLALYAKRETPLGDGRYAHAERYWRLALERGADPRIMLDKETPAYFVGAEDHRLLRCLVEHGVLIDDTLPTKSGLRFATHALKRWREQCLVNKTPEMLQRIDDNFVEVMRVVLSQPVELKRKEKGHLSFLHSLLWHEASSDRAAYVMDALICIGVPLCMDAVGDAQYLKGKSPKTVAVIERYHLKKTLEETLSGRGGAAMRKM